MTDNRWYGEWREKGLTELILQWFATGFASKFNGSERSTWTPQTAPKYWQWYVIRFAVRHIKMSRSELNKNNATRRALKGWSWWTVVCKRSWRSCRAKKNRDGPVQKGCKQSEHNQNPSKRNHLHAPTVVPTKTVSSESHERCAARRETGSSRETTKTNAEDVWTICQTHVTQPFQTVRAPSFQTMSLHPGPCATNCNRVSRGLAETHSLHSASLSNHQPESHFRFSAPTCIEFSDPFFQLSLGLVPSLRRKQKSGLTVQLLTIANWSYLTGFRCFSFGEVWVGPSLQTASNDVYD